MIEVGAGIVAWAGASLVVLGDGRRGLALGVAVAGLGLGALAWMHAGPVAAAAIAAGGVIAAAGRLLSGQPGWHVMPAGSTPRLVLCVAVGLVGLWFGFAVTTGPGGGARFAALTLLVLAPARILWSEDRAALLTATGVLALAMGVAAAVGAVTTDIWAYVAAALLAAAVAWLPPRTPRVA